VTKAQICYTPEALKYAHSAFLASIVACQWACHFAAQGRSLSLAQINLYNKVGAFSLIFETLLIIFLTYLLPINRHLGTRPNPPAHFFVPVFAYVCLIIFSDELKKLYIRRGQVQVGRGKVKITGWFARNTLF